MLISVIPESLRKERRDSNKVGQADYGDGSREGEKRKRMSVGEMILGMREKR